MRRLTLLLLVIAAVTLTAGPVTGRGSAADLAIAPSLVISQLKITSSNGQFVTLYNTTGTTLDLSKYQLEYFNNYDLAKATSSRLIALSGTVPPHGYAMINDSALLLCYQLAINSVSLGFSSTAGMVEVVAFNQGAVGGAVTPSLQDYAAWSKTTAAGAQTLPTSVNAWLQRLPVDGQYNPTINSPGTGSWQAVQPDAANPCNLVSANSPNLPVLTGLNQLLPPTEPFADMVTADAVAGDPTAPTQGLPAADIGLKAPQITELLPNPEGAGNDSKAEFIELYNSNDVAFDLSGFSLQVGLTTTHKYTFPAGTTIGGKTFKAYFPTETGLSLSNSGSQTKLLDPAGNAISASGTYGTAKDGQAWALANGKWYWTTLPTPGATNLIKQPAAAAKKVSSKKAAGSSIKLAKTKKVKTKLKPSKAALANASSEAPATTPIHPRVLAVVGGLALLYLIYEYRADLANRIYQCRQYIFARRQGRLEVEGRRGD